MVNKCLNVLIISGDEKFLTEFYNINRNGKDILSFNNLLKLDKENYDENYDER